MRYTFVHDCFRFYCCNTVRVVLCSTVPCTSTRTCNAERNSTRIVTVVSLLVTPRVPSPVPDHLFIPGATLQADLMIALVAVIRDLLCEFLSKSLSEKPR